MTTAGAAKATQIGQIQLADFINEEGLQPTGNNLLVESAASGAPQVGTPGTNGLGTLQQGSLETSNVNTVTELVNMIECQRAYEMNSKAISTTDQMLQYLTTNLHDVQQHFNSRDPPPRPGARARSGRHTARWRARVGLRNDSGERSQAASRSVARVLPPPTPRTDGAIYQAGQQMELFADLKARRVGDVLTIVLNESTNASKNAITKTTKTTAVTRTRHRRSSGRVHHHQGQCRSSTTTLTGAR